MTRRFITRGTADASRRRVWQVPQNPERQRRVARRPSTSPARQAFSIVALLAFATPACADIDPLSGIDFVRITHPGNAPWPGNGTPNDRAIGRGGVVYESRPSFHPPALLFPSSVFSS